MKAIIVSLLASCVISLAQTNTDRAGYVTNANLLTPFTLTNSAGNVITDAVLVKLMPDKFIYKTPGGAMGTRELDSLPMDLQEKIGHASRQTNSKAISNFAESKDPLATGQLMSAIQYSGDAKTVKLLLEKGADVNAKDNEGWHPLQLAAKRGDLELIKVLLENGAEVNASNDLGGTALMSAARRGYIDVAKLLLDKGANVNAKMGDGYTALMSAAEEGQIEVVKLLLAKGAKINMEDNIGRSALDRASKDWTSKNGHFAIVELLRQAGASKSSFAKQDEEMADNLKKLHESDAALSNNLENLRQSSVVPSTRPDLEILSLSTKLTEANNVWWEWSYQVKARNNTSQPIHEFPRLLFLDAEGFIIEDKRCEMKLSAGETKMFLDTALVELPGAARVKTVKVE
jgi:hypothetical protein